MGMAVRVAAVGRLGKAAGRWSTMAQKVMTAAQKIAGAQRIASLENGFGVVEEDLWE